MKKLFFDRRGEVPVVILVIGVLAICALTLFSFYTSSERVKRGLDSINAVDDAMISVKKIELYREIGVPEDELDLLFGVKLDGERKYVLSETDGVSVRFYLSD